MQAIRHLPVCTRISEIPLTHSLTGWPREGACRHCGARAVYLFSAWRSATYECRGTPTNPYSAYGPDRCGRVFEVRA